MKDEQCQAQHHVTKTFFLAVCDLGAVAAAACFLCDLGAVAAAACFLRREKSFLQLRFRVHLPFMRSDVQMHVSANALTDTVRETHPRVP